MLTFNWSVDNPATDADTFLAKDKHARANSRFLKSGKNVGSPKHRRELRETCKLKVWSPEKNVKRGS